MKFVIITHVPHIISEKKFFAYAPYVREMNIWLNHVDEVVIVAPCQKTEKTAIDIAYQHNNIDFFESKDFNLKSPKAIIKTLLALPRIFYQTFRAMQQADHIHLRCPGNMGLIGCLVQILFPKKKKSAKYAGNWDPTANQPWSYRLQKWILSNTFLTRNMQVLVYGEWPNQTKNIKPFFTATYHESEIRNDKLEIENDKLQNTNKIKCLFVGTLSPGKRPLYAIQLVEKLKQKGFDIALDLLGEGKERESLQTYINENNLQDFIFLKGNQDKETTKQAYQNSHLMILPSKSEGWPKAVAEAMFWGCVPVVTPVSCVPYMIDHGNRGVALSLELGEDVQNLMVLMGDENKFKDMCTQAQKWSQQYTMDKFEAEIAKILQA